VVHSYTSGWKGARNIPDPPVPGAIEFMLAALGAGYDVVIHSSRARYFGGIWAMRRWLRKNSRIATSHVVEGYEHQFVEDVWDRESLTPGLPCLFQVRFARWKPAAIVTLDDRGWRFDGTFPDPKALMAAKPWNK
jgi:hypothetical protein